MLSKELKSRLQKRPELIIKILQECNCEKIKDHSDYISSTAGEGHNNPSGVVCYIDSEFLNCEMYTNVSFSGLAIKDFISVIQTIRNCSYPQAVKFICKVCQFDYYSDEQEEEQDNTLLNFLDFIETGVSKPKEEHMHILPDSVLDQYVKLPHIAWLREGIKPEVMKRAEISYDVDSDAITIPIRTSINELCGVKVRNLNPEIADESKYIYQYPCPKSKILYHSYLNYQSIKKSGYVVVYEAEKSCLKSESWGVSNCVSIGGKQLSESQIDSLLRFGQNIVLALDVDVTDEEIQANVKKLIEPIKICDIYVLRDPLHLYLGSSDSPADSKEMCQSYKNLIEKVT